MLSFFKKRVERKQLRTYLKQVTGLSPRNLDYYIEAFTHKSATATSKVTNEDNERLEFLGDSVLDLLIGEYLFHKYPREREGFYSKIRARIVNRQYFNKIGSELQLEPWLRQYSRIRAEENVSASMLGNTYEALVGAMYLDHGLEGAKSFIDKQILAKDIDMELAVKQDPNYKSQLLEWAQKHNKVIKYRTIDTVVEEGRRLYTIDVTIDNRSTAQAIAFRKRNAEQEASKRALTALHLLKNSGVSTS